MTQQRVRSYSELTQTASFEERFEYLSLRGVVGQDKFGFDRWINQMFYRSREWRDLRQFVIARDMGCDLGVRGYEMHSNIHIHHMNPMTPEDIQHDNEDILNPEFLISASQITHNAIHYGADAPQRVPVDRVPGDTRPW